MTNKICFVAPSGFGKSTAIKILKERYNVINIKIAKPLYDLQEYFYKIIEKDITGEQDGELLQFLGTKIRKEAPYYLLNKFQEVLQQHTDSNYLITNDDCRPPDYETLKNLGFVFVKINGFRRDRNDHSIIDANSQLEWQNEIYYDYCVDNTDSLAEYKKNLIALVDIIFKKESL